MFFYYLLGGAAVLGIRQIVLILAAVIPAAVLLIMVYKSDRLEKENPRYLGRLLLWGIVSTFLASMYERLGNTVLSIFFWNSNGVLYRLLLYFVVVGLSEEAAKYILLSRNTWNSSLFNCKYDAIVYSVTVSLGFALWENISYVLNYGFKTALVRAITAVPGHACFGVIMGFWYGLAKRCERRGDITTKDTCLKLAVLIPAFVHGCYDFIATSTVLSEWVFVVFVIIMFLVSLILAKRLSKTDAYL